MAAADLAIDPIVRQVLSLIRLQAAAPQCCLHVCLHWRLVHPGIMSDTAVNQLHRSTSTLDQCAATLKATFIAFMLHHLPVKTFAALRGTCHALKDVVDGAPYDILLTAVRASKLLPPAISKHLSCSQYWQTVLSRHASVVRRLRPGVCNSIPQLKSDHHVPPLAFGTSTHHSEPCSDHLEVIQISNFQQIPAGLLTHCKIVWHV